ncbi:MAG: hypothetical protein ACREAB_15540 [Blastocatellia bacterium]
MLINIGDGRRHSRRHFAAKLRGEYVREHEVGESEDEEENRYPTMQAAWPN